MEKQFNEYSLIRLFEKSKDEIINHITSLNDEDRYLRFGYLPKNSMINKYVNYTFSKINTESNANTGSVAALKKIRRKLIIRRVLTAAVAVILTLIAAAAGYNHWYFNEKYMTLENSGMYVKNNSLYSSNNLINRMKVQYTEDGKTEFVYAIDAPYAGTLELKGDDMLLQDFSKKTEEVSPEDDSTPETVTEVYYMSEEAGKKSLELTELEAKGDLDAAEKIVDEMKQESKLIWSEQEDRNTASSMLK